MTYLVGEPEAARAPESAIASDRMQAVFGHGQLTSIHGATLRQLRHLGDRLDLRQGTQIVRHGSDTVGDRLDLRQGRDN